MKAVEDSRGILRLSRSGRLRQVCAFAAIGAAGTAGCSLLFWLLRPLDD
jgi:hypothetical protein